MKHDYLDALFGLSGQTAIVVGGTGVLVGALADGLAAAGAFVVVAGRNAERGEARVSAIREAGGDGCFLAVDAVERKSIENLLSKTLETRDRADILESSHRVIQEELAEERQFNQTLNAELTRERATRKVIEETIESHQKALEFERQRVDGQLSCLAKRMDENHQELSTSLREYKHMPDGEFAANPY